ncbi:hypothetical protein BC937DRAFT_92651, partial [Endogone sp. FLAS-F59071]
ITLRASQDIYITQRSDLDLRYRLLEDNIVILDKDITENGEIQVAVAKSSYTRSATCLKDEIGGRNLETTATNGEIEIAEGGGVTRDSVGAIAIVGRAQFLGQVGGNTISKEEERGPSVNDAVEAAADISASRGEVVNGNSPKSLRVVDWDGGQGAIEFGLVVTTKDEFPTATHRLLAQKDTEFGVADEFLANEVVHWGLDTSDRSDGVKGQTQEAISDRVLELRGDGAGHVNGLAGDREAGKRHGICTQGTTGGRHVAICDAP